MEAMTLLELNKRLAALITIPSTQDVWITAELSDVAVRGGHCYMELLQKNPDTGATIARARGTIWANVYRVLSANFVATTGQQFSTGLKVMLRVSVNMHPVYGMSLNITAVNPEYTMGDLIRRRQEIIMRLQKEGILDMNRTIECVSIPQRIAIISAPGAAGYGDFINQLYNNPSRLRFITRLFPAVMQGERTPETIIASLEEIASQYDQWDCVVIIRGGGATSDLAAFENYDLAANVAQFPLPVIIGIGHERDITVLDSVAYMRVKTPTAAAEWLISQSENALNNLRNRASELLQAVSDRISGDHKQLAYYEGVIPLAATSLCERVANKLRTATQALNAISTQRITAELSRLDFSVENIKSRLETRLQRQRDNLLAKESLLDVLSPQATLRRGYSITRINGMSVKSVTQISKGDEIITTFADGNIISITT